MKIFRIIVLIVTCLSMFYQYSCGSGDGSENLSENAIVVSTNLTGKIYTTDSLYLTFYKPMDKTSIESAIKITGSDPVAGTFSWDENTVTFKPDSLLKTNHQYTLTISTDAKDADGNNLETEYVLTFIPQLNLYDVNADKIDDFTLGAPYHMSAGKTPGIAYLFLGRNSWSNINLSKDEPSASFIPEVDLAFGYDTRVIGDFNGDGFADIAISAPFVELNHNDHTGLVLIQYGSKKPKNVSITQHNFTDIDGLIFGNGKESFLGLPIMPAGDINQDGLADFILGGGVIPTGDNAEFWLILGRKEKLPTPALFPTTSPTVNEITDISFKVDGQVGSQGYSVATCDVNGDGFNDMVFGAPGIYGSNSRGKILVVAGSENPKSRDLMAGTADMTITGETDGDYLGLAVSCGDINNDGYADIVAGTIYPLTKAGKAYLILGGPEFTNYDLSVDKPSAKFQGKEVKRFFGATMCNPGDINDDGFGDLVVGAIVETSQDGTPFTGIARVFYGSETPRNFNLASENADLTYSGPKPPIQGSYLGFCKQIGDVNGDGIYDLLLGATLAHGGGAMRGQAYLIFGATNLKDMNFETDRPNVTITGASDGDMLMVSPLGDIN